MFVCKLVSISLIDCLFVCLSICMSVCSVCVYVCGLVINTRIVVKCKMLIE